MTLNYFLKNYIPFFILTICIFPFLGKLYTGDLQPLYFIFLSLYFIISLLYQRTVPDKAYILLFFTAIFIIILRLRFGYDLATNLRGLVTYLTPLLMIYLIYSSNISEKSYEAILKASMIIYFIFGLLEYFNMQQIAFFLLDFRENLGRGVASLAPEPSMFGFTYTLIFISLNFLTKPNIFYWGLFLFGMLLCGSLSAILASSVIFLSLFQRPIMVIFYSLLVIILINILPLDAFIPERLLGLIKISSMEIFLLDESINERAGHLFFIFTELHHYFFGGSEPWGSAYYKFIAESSIFFYGSSFNNVLSGIGALIYDGGLLGIIYLLLILRKSLALKNYSTFFIISWMLIAIQSVSFAHPMLTLPLALQLNNKNGQ